MQDSAIIEIFRTLLGSDIDRILIVTGILLILLSVLEKLGSHALLNPESRKSARIVGLFLVISGIAVHFAARLVTVPPHHETLAERRDEPSIAALGDGWLRGDYGRAFAEFRSVRQQTGESATGRLAEARLNWLEPFEGRILCADDFQSDETTGPGGRWLFHQPGPGTGSGEIEPLREDGNVVLLGRGHFHARPVISDGPRGGFEIHFRFQLRSRNAAGHVNIMMDSPTRLTIGFDRNGIHIWEGLSDREIGGERRRFAVEGDWHVLRAVVRDRHVRVFLDGQPGLEYRTVEADPIALTEFNLEPLDGIVGFDDLLIVSARAP